MALACNTHIEPVEVSHVVLECGGGYSNDFFLNYSLQVLSRESAGSVNGLAQRDHLSGEYLLENSGLCVL